MPNIWAWNSFKQCPAEKPACFNSTIWVVTFTEATTKLFVKCMLCCIWQHEWEAARSDQGWTSHLTSKMKGKIGHYRRCIQTTKHNSTLAYILHKWILNAVCWSKKELFRGIEKLNAKWNGGDKTCGSFPYLIQQECHFKNVGMKQFCSHKKKPEAVVSGFSPQLEARGDKKSRYCFVAGIAESVDSFIDSFGMSHVTRRHLCSTLGPIPSAGKAATRESPCLSVSGDRTCILYFTPLKWKYLKVWRWGDLFLCSLWSPMEQNLWFAGYKGKLTGLKPKGDLMLRYHKQTFFEGGVKVSQVEVPPRL